MTLKSLDSIIKGIRDSNAIWKQKAKLDFALDIVKLMDRANVSRAALAKRLDVSAPYVTKVLRGDENVSIDTMVRFARALDAHVSIRVCDSRSVLRWIEVIDGETFFRPGHTTRDWTHQKPYVANNYLAANDHEAEPAAA